MTYSIDLRQRVIAFVDVGGTKAEAARRFSVSEGSVHNWLKRENIAPTKVERRHRKLDWKALEKHIQDRPDAKLRDRAEHFGVHIGIEFLLPSQLPGTALYDTSDPQTPIDKTFKNWYKLTENKFS